MSGADFVACALACHPDSPATAVRGVSAGVRSAADGALALRFELHGDIARIEVPALSGPERRDGLWRHTCFECFVRAETQAYLELNFSPSREWAAYAFRDYRDAAALPAAFDPGIAVKREAELLVLTATVPATALTLTAGARVRIGLSAVVEEISGAVSYWALRHAPGKPDFHHPDAFALTL